MHTQKDMKEHFTPAIRIGMSKNNGTGRALIRLHTFAKEYVLVCNVISFNYDYWESHGGTKYAMKRSGGKQD